jgi:hypothetical protein
MSNKFKFDQEVLVLEHSPLPQTMWRTKGLIVGMSHGADGVWEYGVRVYADDDLVWQLEERYLEAVENDAA